MSNDYRFKGIPQFVSAAGLTGSAANKAPGVWFIARAVDALGQLCQAAPEHRQGMLDVAIEHRENLSKSLAALDAAIHEVRSNCFPPMVVSSMPSPSSPKTRQSSGQQSA